MKHLGDITKINGAEIPAVDVITGGSPCQDLSVAGKRAGLDGERSGLFMEQIRIVKEMREHDRRTTGRADVNLRPRFMVWENVPGAFSSNGGKDFQAVLTEIVRIAEPDAPDVPMPAKKWSKAGCLYDELGRWSVAWRVHDAQFWGVPQRRKRIALVADFGGTSAPEILFERESVPGNIEQIGEEGESSPADIEGCSSEAISFQERAGKPGGVKESSFKTTEREQSQLSTINTQSDEQKVFGISSYDSNAIKSSNPQSGIYEAETSRTLDNNGGNPACNQGGMIVIEGNGTRESHKGDGYAESETMYTLNTVEQHAVCVSQDAYDKYSESEHGATIKQSGGAYGGGQRVARNTVGALCAADSKGVGNQYVADGKLIIE